MFNIFFFLFRRTRDSWFILSLFSLILNHQFKKVLMDKCNRLSIRILLVDSLLCRIPFPNISNWIIFKWKKQSINIKFNRSQWYHFMISIINNFCSSFENEFVQCSGTMSSPHIHHIHARKKRGKNYQIKMNKRKNMKQMRTFWFRVFHFDFSFKSSLLVLCSIKMNSFWFFFPLTTLYTLGIY